MWKMEKLYYSVSYYPTLVTYYPTLVFFVVLSDAFCLTIRRLCFFLSYYPTLVVFFVVLSDACVFFVVLIARYKIGKYFLRNKFIKRKPKIIRVNDENGKNYIIRCLTIRRFLSYYPTLFVLLSDACVFLSYYPTLFVLPSDACVFVVLSDAFCLTIQRLCFLSYYPTLVFFVVLSNACVFCRTIQHFLSYYPTLVFFVVLIAGYKKVA